MGMTTSNVSRPCRWRALLKTALIDLYCCSLLSDRVVRVAFDVFDLRGV